MIPRNERPKTFDPKVWAETHTQDGRLNAEGLRRGMQESYQVGPYKTLLYLANLREPQGFGLQLLPTYRVSDAFNTPRDFPNLKAAWKYFDDRVKEARAAYDALPKETPVVW